MKLIHILTLLVFAMSLLGCQPAKQYLGDPELPYSPEHEPIVGDILHLPSGFYVDQQAMLEQINRQQVIFVGETHDNPASHRLQEEILQSLQQHNDGNITLAMEMFTPSQQAVLDLWSAGKLAEKDFLQQLDWQQNWRMNFAFYRPLLNYCRDHKIPILALNAEKDIKQIARKPIADLTTEERNQLPAMVNDPYQQAMVKAVFGGHKSGHAMPESFQRIQTLWDETMAQNLAKYIAAADANEKVMVIAGGNHIRYGFGIPRRLLRRIPVSYILIGSEELDVPADKQDRLMNIIKPDYPMPPYHFIKYTAYEDLKNPGIKLGIFLDQVANGLQIKKVIPESIAAQNKLQSGDILTMIGAQPLRETFDLIYELQQKKTGDTFALTLTREDQVITKQIVVTSEKIQGDMHP